MKKIVIAGGTGFLGEVLVRHYQKKASITILTRTSKKSHSNVSYEYWDGETLADWKKALEGADVLINLAGKSVNCRYTAKNKAAIYKSRNASTTVLGKAVLQCQNPPKVWLNSSSATIYRHEYKRTNNEFNGILGEGFSVDVCQQWEGAFNQFELPHTRKVTMRTSIVLGNGGGVYAALVKLAQKGLGGRQGDGMQWVSWIHEQDFVRAVEHVVNDEEASGIINFAAPTPLLNLSFMKAIRKKVKAPFGLNQTRWMVKLGALFMGTESELVLKSRRVVSKRLPELGFQFRYPTVEEALKYL